LCAKKHTALPAAAAAAAAAAAGRLAAGQQQEQRRWAAALQGSSSNSCSAQYYQQLPRDTAKLLMLQLLSHSHAATSINNSPMPKADIIE
jgi:hypothetical protein